MKKVKVISIVCSIFAMAFFISAYSSKYDPFGGECESTNTIPTPKNKENQRMNMFVSHGHCSLPFTGNVEKLEINTPTDQYTGNPIERLKLSFEINPNTFFACAGDDLTSKVKTPGLFIGENNENITFKSTDVYTMGIDWYQINGNMTIKGVERSMKFFATGIRDPKDIMSSALIIEGQINLVDWGIDYNKIVNGDSKNINTKWMHFNMKIDMTNDNC